MGCGGSGRGLAGAAVAGREGGIGQLERWLEREFWAKFKRFQEKVLND